MELAKFLEELHIKLDEPIPEWINTAMANIPDEWHRLLFGKTQRKILVKIFDKLDSLDDPVTQLSPQPKYIFEFARLTPLKKLNVVILGQDPYPNPMHAHGLAFSSLDRNVPSSLRNIYKCLQNSRLINKKPSSSDLTAWAMRGILLLNCSLTTKVGSANVHKNLWSEYTDVLIKKICKRFTEKNKILIFMLWGNVAGDKANIIQDHIILRWRHPSPLAQNCDERNKFINCTNFKETTDILNEEIKDFDADSYWQINKRVIEVYTDGSAHPQVNKVNAKNGYACLFTKGSVKGLVLFGSSPKFVLHPIKKIKMCSTSQRAEGTALLKAIAKCNTFSYNLWEEIQIVTDSEFWHNMLTNYLPYWERNKTDFNTKENPDITIQLWELWKSLKEKGRVTIRHIPSHGKKGLKDAEPNSQEWYDYNYNEMVDQIANMARNELEYDEYNEDDDLVDI